MSLSAAVVAKRYSIVGLYDDAITVSLPSDFLDASNIRQIPDNQEVRLSPVSLTSIIFDILERAEPPSHPCKTDQEALQYHFEDVTSSSGEQEKQPSSQGAGERTVLIEAGSRVIMPNLGSDTVVWTMLAVQKPLETKEERNSQHEFTALFLILVRLAKVKTDILISVSVPHVPGEKGVKSSSQSDLTTGNEGPLVREGREIRNEIIQTFKVSKWDLFSAD